METVGVISFDTTDFRNWLWTNVTHFIQENRVRDRFYFNNKIYIKLCDQRSTHGFTFNYLYSTVRSLDREDYNQIHTYAFMGLRPQKKKFKFGR